jgi:hypothetical protein
MKNALTGLRVRPKRRANGSPRTGETSADLLRSVPTSFPSGAPAEQPSWRDIEAYDPQTLSYAAGRGITGALEGTKQLLGGARDYLGGFMQSVRERSPTELQGTAPARSKETYASVNRAVSEAAQDPLTTARKLASAFVDVGIEAAKSPASMTEFIAGNITPGGRSKPAVAQVVKPKGGDFPKKLGAIENLKTWEPEVGAETSKERVINNWLDTKLNRYIRTEMATPEDPIRKLAEQGILHVDPEMINYDPVRYGDPDLGPKVQALLAESPAAQVWEGATDLNMGYETARNLVRNRKDSVFLDDNPWLVDVAKKDPNRRIYLPELASGRDLGFDHLRDELQNSIDPASGLPRQLQLTDEQLGRMSVPDAVRHVSKINTWRDKQKAEANFALATNAATVPFKDYPEQRYGWFQLTTDSFENRQVLQDALNYEADVMKHCVRGYCDAVLAGRSQIYSLRDKKTGEPHVTIEVIPAVDPYGLEFQDRLTPQTRAEYREKIRQWRVRNPNVTGELDYEQMTQALKEAGVPPKYYPIVEQIKGKNNKKPKDEYLPFVQDFVRSGQWDSVEELGNAGLVDLLRHKPKWEAEQLQREGVRYVTPQELEAFRYRLKGEQQ